MSCINCAYKFWCFTSGKCWNNTPVHERLEYNKTEEFKNKLAAKKERFQFRSAHIKPVVRPKNVSLQNPVPAKPKRQIIFERDQYKCLACGSELDLTIDHIIPLSKGGTNKTNNLQTLCGNCNRGKADRIRDYRLASKK